MQSWGVGILAIVTILLLGLATVPVEIVAVGVLVVLGISGLLPVSELFRGFSEPAVFLIASLFILSEGMARAKVVRWLATTLTIHIGKKPFLLSAALYLLAGLLAMFLNDTGSIAIFLPLVTALLVELGLPLRGFLLPTGYMALLGGSATLIGSSSNVIVSGFLESRHLPTFQMFDFFRVGGGAFLIGLLYLMVARPLLLGRMGEGELQKEPAARKFFVEVQLGKKFPYLGKQLQDVPLLPEAYSPPPDLSSSSGTAREEREKDRYRSFLKASWSLIRHPSPLHSSRPDIEPYRSGPLKEGDRLRLFVTVSQLQRVLEREGANLLGQSSQERSDAVRFEGPERKDLEDEDVIVCEAIPAPHSGLIGRPLATLPYIMGSDISVVGIHRVDPPPDPLSRAVLSNGDVLLLKGRRESFDWLRAKSLFLYLDEVEREVFRSEKALTAMGILVLFVLASVFHWIPTVLAALLAALGMVGFGIVRIEEALGAIEWRVIFLMGSMFPLGWALERSPLGSVLVHGLKGMGGGLGPEGALFLVLATTMVAVQFLSHTLVALFMAPVALSIAVALHLSPMPFLAAVSLGSASVFMTPFSHPVNIMTWSAGNYRLRDYLRVGTGLVFLILVWGMWEIPHVWPFHG